jgi:hypothetical protein
MRERLAEHYQETHNFSAFFLSYSKTPEGSNVVCLRQICIGQKWVADHVWVHRSKQMKQLELMAGDIIQFEARVCRYSRGIPRPHVDDIEYDYGLEKIREIRVLKRHIEGTEHAIE